MNIKQKLAQFMSGRYGTDKLTYFLIGVLFSFFIINSFAKSSVITLASLALLFWTSYRIMSKDYTKRRRENDLFVSIYGRAKKKVLLQYNRIREIKTHRYVTCPGCKITLRLPRKKGTHEVECPRCHKSFQVKNHF